MDGRSRIDGRSCVRLKELDHLSMPGSSGRGASSRAMRIAVSRNIREIILAVDKVRKLYSQQAAFDSEGNGSGAIRDAKFFQDMADVGFHGGLTDRQLGGDLFVGQSFGD